MIQQLSLPPAKLETLKTRRRKKGLRIRRQLKLLSNG
jgi:hypothetical protein